MSFKVNIEKPCQENWSNMSPTERGRFCAMCQKEVTDLTQLSHSEVASFLKGNKSPCVRMTKTQLDASYATNHFSLQPLNRVALVLGLSLASTNFVQAQKVEPKTHQTKASEENKKVACSKKVSKKEHDTKASRVSFQKESDKYLLKGQLLLEEEAMIGGTVMLYKSDGTFDKDSNIGTITDVDGTFLIEVPETHLREDQSVQFRISYVGVESKIVQLQLDETKEVFIEETIDLMGDVVIVGGISSRPSLFKRFLTHSKVLKFK